MFHIDHHLLTFSIFLKFYNYLSPTSHPFILPFPYILLLGFASSMLCNKQWRSLPFLINKVENCAWVMAWECKHYYVWWKATTRSGISIFVFIAWEYNVLEMGPRWSSEIVNKHFLFLPKFAWFLQGHLFSSYILQKYNACWVLTCFQAFVEVKFWFSLPWLKVCTFYLLFQVHEGDTRKKKSRKYVSKKIGCNILVVGRNYKLISFKIRYIYSNNQL